MRIFVFIFLSLSLNSCKTSKSVQTLDFTKVEIKEILQDTYFEYKSNRPAR